MQIRRARVLHPRYHYAPSVRSLHHLRSVEVKSAVHGVIGRHGVAGRPLVRSRLADAELLRLPVIASDYIAYVIALRESHRPLGILQLHVHRTCYEHMSAVQREEVRTFPHYAEPASVFIEHFIETPAEAVIAPVKTELGASPYVQIIGADLRVLRAASRFPVRGLSRASLSGARDDRPEGSVLRLPDIRIPELVRVPSLGKVIAREDRVSVIFYVFGSAADSDALRLAPSAYAVRFSGVAARVHQKMSAVRERESRAREASGAVIRLIRRHGAREIFPDDEVAAHGVTPVHRAPVGVIGMVLVEKMVLSIMV